MISQLTIPPKNTRETAFDQQQLYALGLQHVQRLASRIWTDYNVHDPGITTLELLCYALTDLSYRASFPIQDLLASASDNAKNMQDQFFTAKRILPNRPLTWLDYRKLLIDLKGVKNAWLKPALLTYYADTVEGKLLSEDPHLPGIAKVDVAGVYEVIIEYMDTVSEAAEKDEIKQKVLDLLQANRNLCEDFRNISEIEVQPFVLCGALDLTPDADVVGIKAEILFRVQAYLSPPVNNYTLSDMLERQKTDGSPYTVEAIFVGPLLNCGFIDDDELAQAELRTEVRLSDLISIIMDIKGVQAVRELVINPGGTTTPLDKKWLVPVASGKKALLNNQLSRLTFYKRNMPVVPDSTQVDQYYAQLNAAAVAKAEVEISYDLPIPLGEFRQPDTYYSFQNHFPALYGLSESGLSSSADAARRALAYQLKAYLLFFDQVMADYFAQLSHVKELFSTDPDLHRTYFYQVVDSFADYQKIYGTTDIMATLQNDVEDQTVHLTRRNRFLDHLIARFAERFNDFVAIMYSAFGSSPGSMVTYKCEFLKQYPAVSSGRSVAFNYTQKDESSGWNSENVSGLEKRLAGLLGIRNFTRRNLGNLIYDANAEVEGNPTDKFLFRVRKKTGEIIFTSNLKYDTADLARSELQRAISLGLLPSGYDRKTATNGKYFFNIIDGKGQIVARGPVFYNTEAQLNDAVDAGMDYLRVNYSDEGMFLIENILLRPEQATDPFLPICAAPATPDLAEVDPYSYRLHIILPAYGSRFSNMDFRRFAESVIREETPAHILPKICWISKEDMIGLETKYRDWISLKAGAAMDQRQEKLTAFFQALFAVRNVYPPQQLRECVSGEEQPKFIMGQTALGSEKTGES